MRTVVRAPGVSTRDAPTSSSTAASRPSSMATLARSDSAKSSSPRIAAAVMCSTFALVPV